MTFTVIAREPELGLLGIAQCTNPLSVGGRCPFIRANVGAVSTQAYTDPGLGPLAIELLSLGYSPCKVIRELSDSDPDFGWRQVGIIDRHGRTAVHTGDQTKPHGGSIEGPNFLVMGNFLKSPNVVERMAQAWRDSEGKLFEERLLAAIAAGRDEGGDAGGHRSSVLLVYGTEPYARTDLRVDWASGKDGAPDAIDVMTGLLEKWRPLIPYYEERPHKPQMPGWEDWLKENNLYAPFET